MGLVGNYKSWSLDGMYPWKMDWVKVYVVSMEEEVG
jgi:hypothetical protein